MCKKCEEAGQFIGKDEAEHADQLFAITFMAVQKENKILNELAQMMQYMHPDLKMRKNWAAIQIMTEEAFHAYSRMVEEFKKNGGIAVRTEGEGPVTVAM